MAFWNPKPPIERVRAGLRINLDPEEREVVRSLFEQLRDLLLADGTADGGGQPSLTRLFPRAYHLPEHAEHDAEYQRLMREELVASRLTGIDTCLKALDAQRPLTDAEGAAFMQALNGVRLVLGTILDVTEDLDVGEIPDSDPRVGEYQLYSYLSWLLEWTVRAVS